MKNPEEKCHILDTISESNRERIHLEVQGGTPKTSKANPAGKNKRNIGKLSERNPRKNFFKYHAKIPKETVGNLS